MHIIMGSSTWDVLSCAGESNKLYTRNKQAEISQLNSRLCEAHNGNANMQVLYVSFPSLLPQRPTPSVSI